ncbi:hypothetical protein BY996DRAFT_8040947 [Phakopsora pachyrhizi]|nr:hypothetical protein BY996DRAFT_8040947 [Phakopsora pachyrhizi]
MNDDGSGLMDSMRHNGGNRGGGGLNDEYDTTKAGNRGNMMDENNRSNDDSNYRNRSGVSSGKGMVSGTVMGGNQGNKSGMGDKVKGGYEEMKGRVTRDPAMVQQGERRRQGEMQGGEEMGGKMSGAGGGGY